MRMMIGTAPALALALAACGSNTPASDVDMANEAVVNEMVNDTALPEALPPATAMTGQAFANTAAASDAFEIESSELAGGKPRSDAVKQFAQKMIDAHTTSTARLKTAAAAASPAITPDAALPVDLKGKLDALKTASAATFDADYVREQVAAHENTLAAVRAYADNGDVDPLKRFAADMVRPVSEHLDMARALKP